MIRTIVICLLMASTAQAQTTPTPMQAKPKQPYTEKPKPEPAPAPTPPLPKEFPVTTTRKEPPLPSLAGARRCVMQTTPISDILQCDNGITVIYIRP